MRVLIAELGVEKECGCECTGPEWNTYWRFPNKEGLYTVAIGDLVSGVGQTCCPVCGLFPYVFLTEDEYKKVEEKLCGPI